MIYVDPTGYEADDAKGDDAKGDDAEGDGTEEHNDGRCFASDKSKTGYSHVGGKHSVTTLNSDCNDKAQGLSSASAPSASSGHSASAGDPGGFGEDGGSVDPSGLDNSIESDPFSPVDIAVGAKVAYTLGKTGFKYGITFFGRRVKAFKHNYKYAGRVRKRGVQDPKSHNFPYSFDDEVLSVKPISNKKGYNIYQKPGTMDKKEGVFEIGVTKEGVIDHRFFRPRKR